MFGMTHWIHSRQSNFFLGGQDIVLSFYMFTSLIIQMCASVLLMQSKVQAIGDNENKNKRTWHLVITKKNEP